MRISSFYYLAYPDNLPSDPLVAASEVYVEVAENDGDLNSFDYTIAVDVVTIGYLKLRVAESGFVAARPMIIVERFEDSIVGLALDAILPNIADFSRRK